MSKQSSLVKLARNPLVRQVAAWLLPIIISYITNKVRSRGSSRRNRPTKTK